MLKILEGYAKDVKDRGFCVEIPQIVHPMQHQLPGQKVAFIGSEQCEEVPLEGASPSGSGDDRLEEEAQPCEGF